MTEDMIAGDARAPIALAIAPAVYLAGRLGAGHSEQIALDILKERYARNAHSARPLGSDQ